MNIRRWSVTIFACLLVFGGLATYKVLEIQAAIAFGESFPEHSETVEPTRTVLLDYTPTVSVIGEAVAPRRVDLRNELPGRLTAVNFRSGERVTEGQLMVQFDISEETADLASARARAELAQSVYKRTSNLRKNNAISQEQLDEARANLRVVEAEIARLESQISKKTLRAPFSGVVGIHQLEPGQFLQANTLVTNLIGEDANIWVDFSVPQFYNDLAVGSKVSLRPVRQQSAEPAATSVDFQQAEIVAVSSIVSSNARSRQYRASIERTVLAVAPATALEVKVPVAPARKVVAVKATAVQHDEQGQYVYLLVADEQVDHGFRAHRQAVTVLARRALTQQGQWVLIEQGLQEGDQVAAAGAFKLYEGILVYTGQRRQLKTTAEVAPVSKAASTDGEGV